MLPLKDDIQSPRPPVATLILIVILIGLAVSGWHPDLDATAVAGGSGRRLAC